MAYGNRNNRSRVVDTQASVDRDEQLGRDYISATGQHYAATGGGAVRPGGVDPEPPSDPRRLSEQSRQFLENPQEYADTASINDTAWLLSGQEPRIRTARLAFEGSEDRLADAQEALDPYISAFVDQESPEEFIRGTQMSEEGIDVSLLDPDMVQRILQTGMGYLRREGPDGPVKLFYRDPAGSVGFGDIGAQALIQASDIYQGEQAITERYEQGTEEMEEALFNGNMTYKDFLAKLDQDQTSGMDGLKNMFKFAQGGLDAASAISTQNRDKALNLISTRLNTLQTNIDKMMQMATDSRTEALASHGDQTARLLQGMTRAQELQFQAQSHEIDSMKGVPAAAKAGMKQRLGVMNAGNIQSTVAQVYASEAQRQDQIRVAQDTNLTNLASTALTASKDALSAGIVAGTSAYTTDSSEQARLAEAGSRLADGFMNSATSFVSNMNTTRQATLALSTAFELDGSREVAMRRERTPVPILDLTSYYGNMYSLAFDVRQDELNHAAAEYDAMRQHFQTTHEDAYDLENFAYGQLGRQGERVGGNDGPSVGEQLAIAAASNPGESLAGLSTIMSVVGKVLGVPTPPA